MPESIDVIIETSTVRCFDNTGYESRNPSTIRLIQEAHAKYPPPPEFRRRVRIHTGDILNPSCTFSYAIPKSSPLSVSFPNYIFDAWPEVGIMSYAEMFQQMVEEGSKPWSDSRVFWIGANTNALRVQCAPLSKVAPDEIDFRLMEWNRSNPTSLHTNTSSYVSLIDHCKYRVLADLGAGGFSARLPLLLASGRPVILADRVFEAWFYWDAGFQPWVHYIPGGSTPASVFDACRWSFDNKDEAAKIGERGREYALQNLTHDAAVRRCATLLWNFSG